jgi:hypothetical protein
MPGSHLPHHGIATSVRQTPSVPCRRRRPSDRSLARAIPESTPARLQWRADRPATTPGSG